MVFDWSTYENKRLEVNIMVKKIKYDWKITVKKSGELLLYAIVTGFIVLWQDDVRFIAVLPLMKAAQNYIKMNWM